MRGSKFREILRVLALQILWPLSHLMSAALPWSTELKWQLSWVGDCLWKLSGDKEVTNKGIYFIFFSILPTPLAYWGMKTPGAIFHQCLTQCLLCRAAFPSPSSRNSTHFPAPYLFSSPLQSTISWRRTESSTWSNIKTEIFSHVYFFYKLCH